MNKNINKQFRKMSKKHSYHNFPYIFFTLDHERRVLFVVNCDGVHA